MKKFAAFLIAFTLLIACVPSVSADTIPDGLGREDTTMEFTFATLENKTISFTPAKTGMYAIVVPDGSKIMGTICTLDVYGNTESVTFKHWMKNYLNYYVYNLDQSTTYNLTIRCSEEGYTGKISLNKWDSSMLLPDCQTIQLNQKVSATLQKGDMISYLFSVPTSGVYSAFTDSNLIDVGAGSTMVDFDVSGSYPEYFGAFDYGNEHGNCWYLEAGSIYEIMVTAKDNAPNSGTFTDNFVIKSGYPACGQYATWNINQSLTVSLDNSKFDRVIYMIEPKTSGKYVIQNQKGVRYFLTDSQNAVIHESQYSGPINENGYVYNLTGGKRYFMCFECYETNAATATFNLTRYDKLDSLELKIIQFTDNYITVALYSNPNCAVVEGIQWSISDSSVFNMNAFGPIAELDALKNGSAVVSATVGGQTVKLTVTTDPETQIISEGKSVYLYARQPKTAATFTPSASGKYEVKIAPHLLQEEDRMRLIIEKPEGGFIYDNYQLSKDTTVTLDLVGGSTYKILLENGIADVTITKVPGTCTQTSPTESTQATQGTQSSQDGNATQPTQNASSPTSPAPDATAPVESTESVENESTKPTYPIVEDDPITDTVAPGKPITQDDITEAIQNTVDSTLSFSTGNDPSTRTFQISSEALQMIVDKDFTLSLEFPAEVNIQLNHDILKAISDNTSSDDIQISVKPQAFSALNNKQQQALDGWNLGWLLSFDLTVDGQNIHDLGGKATISFPNIDPGTEWSVLYLAEDGSVEVMDITCDKNITFSTEHFSHYALVERAEKTTNNTAETSSGWIAIPIVLVFLGGAVAAFFILKKKGLLPFKK